MPALPAAQLTAVEWSGVECSGAVAMWRRSTHPRGHHRPYKSAEWWRRTPCATPRHNCVLFRLSIWRGGWRLRRLSFIKETIAMTML
jgi:hypothetical protein